MKDKEMTILSLASLSKEHRAAEDEKTKVRLYESMEREVFGDTGMSEEWVVHAIHHVILLIGMVSEFRTKGILGRFWSIWGLAKSAVDCVREILDVKNRVAALGEPESWYAQKQLFIDQELLAEMDPGSLLNYIRERHFISVFGLDSKLNIDASLDRHFWIGKLIQCIEFLETSKKGRFKNLRNPLFKLYETILEEDFKFDRSWGQKAILNKMKRELERNF